MQSEGQSERSRIERVIARDGLPAARQWATRIAHVYRRAVLDPHHFAHSGEQRRNFIQSYLELKRFARSGWH